MAHPRPAASGQRRRDRATAQRLPERRASRRVYHPWIVGARPARDRAAWSGSCRRRATWPACSPASTGCAACTSRPPTRCSRASATLREPLDDAAHGRAQRRGDQRHPRRPRPRRAGARRPHAQPRLPLALRQRPPAVHDDRGGARRADAVGRLRAQQPAAVAAHRPRRARLPRAALPRRACSTARPPRRPTSCAATRPPTRRTSTDEGRVTCVVGVQPPYPAEFVVVRIGVTRSGIQVEETGGPGCLRPAPASTRRRRSASP